MIFRTELKPHKLPLEVGFSNRLSFWGSCFAENIGERFARLKFPVDINPHGIIYNPISITSSIQSIVRGDYPSEDDFLERDGMWYSWNHHSQVWNDSSEGLAHEIHRINKQALSHLESCSVLFLTMGTAWVYKHLDRQKWVANCHKVPANEFSKELVAAEELSVQIKSAISVLREINPALQVVLTVSPVRHVRDGLIENNRSKAELIRAVSMLEKSIERCYYLPVYEWVMDDLRDYRFFEKDLVHPNNMALDYVWQNTCESLMNESGLKNVSEMEKFLKGFEHRPFNENSSSHQKFLRGLIEKGNELQSELNVNLRYELNELENKLKSLG